MSGAVSVPDSRPAVLCASGVAALDADSGLYEVMLARFVGALPREEGERVPRWWEVCREFGMSHGGVMIWISQDADRVMKFEQALRLRVRMMEEEALEIADEDGDARVRIDTRFRVAKVWDRERHGDRTEVLQRHERVQSEEHLLGRLREMVEKNPELAGLLRAKLGALQASEAGEGAAAQQQQEKQDALGADPGT